jgi:hypothetical protein
MIMNRRALIPALLLVGAAGLAGCTTAPGTVSPTPTPTTTSPAVTCPAGNWRSTGVAATTNVGTVPVTVTGGADVKTTIGADGAVTADFTGMKPVVYTATVAGSEVTGEFTYQGSISGNVALSGSASATSTGAPSTITSTATTSATASPSGSAGAGLPWRPTGQVNFGDLKLTAKLTKPVALTVIDNVKLTDVTGAQTTQIGNVIDLQPLLRAGQYGCTGNDTLIITPSASGGGPTVAWTFARV